MSPKADIGDKMDISVEIPKIGTRATYNDELYTILSTQTYQEDIGHSVEITTICTILRIDDNGEDLGFPTFSVKSDFLTIQ